MKKTRILLALLLSLLFVFFAVASGEDTESTGDQGADTAQTTKADDTKIGDYSVEILESRLAKDFEGKDVVIIKYKFTNVANEEPASFMFAFDDAAFQDGVGLNKAFVLEDSANYSEDNQSKEIKKGASIEVEVAYELNDTTTDVEIEVKELFSFEERTIKKTFKIAE
jgi:hypothetical protein